MSKEENKKKIKKIKKIKTKLWRGHVACEDESRKVGSKLPHLDYSVDKGKKKGGKAKQKEKRME